jgi:protein-tyrosine phosphatase
MIDIHCHLLPGLDDGAKDVETSQAMCKVAAEDGIEAVVCTPHANDRYPFDPEIVQQKIAEVMAGSGGRPQLYPGCDFHLSYENIQSALADPHRYTINHGMYLLVEFADLAVPPNIEAVFSDFMARGIIPIVTHPERNPWLMSQRSRLFKWVETGALVQVTANSLLGRFGSKPAQFCAWLIEHRLLHFVASDGHNVGRRAPLLRAACEKVAASFGKETAHCLFEEFPRATIENQYIDAPPPDPHPPRRWLGRIARALRVR